MNIYTDLWSLWAVLGTFAPRMRTNCYFRVSDQNSDIALRFNDINFLKGSNNLAIKRRFHAVTLTLDLECL